jgi:hypothetical protein
VFFETYYPIYLYKSVQANGYGGLMIRETADAAAKQAAIFSNLTNILRHETRYTTNGPKQVSSFYKPSPFWLRLERQGDWIFAYYSTTGVTFSYVHGVFVPMQECVEIGLASFTYLPNAQTEAVFSNVEVTGTGSTLTENEGAIAVENVADATSTVSLELFPNPAHYKFTLVLNRPLENNANVIILNLHGQVIDNRQMQAGAVQQDWETDGWAAGVYLLKLQQAGEAPIVRQIVVQK